MRTNHENYKKWIKIGLNVAYYRKEKGLTQLQLAELCGVSRNHMQRIESGYAASVDVFMVIADALDIELYKLFEFR